MTTKSVKRDYVFILLCIISIIASFIVFSLIYISESEYMLLFVSILFVMVLHELIHFTVIRFFCKYARITTLLRRGALMIEYDVLTAKEYIYTSLAPMIFIQIPLSILYIATSSILVLMLAVLHVIGSIPDIFYAIKIAITCRKCMLRLYKENGKVKGYIIVKPSGEETIYLI
ncbi:MAG: DUF3267 domain-containing protein [Ignisphaera sp.]